MLKLRSALFAILAAVVVGAPVVAEPPRSSGEFRRFAVAADHPLASEAGAEILRAGGNAVDAAVATSFALSVVRPFSCGIGGGGFMLIHDPGAPEEKQTVAINYRETAPSAVGPEFFERLDDSTASVRGGSACGVPGTVAGLLYALETRGSMDRARVLAPAIRLARDGFTADSAYAAAAAGLIEKFEKNPEWKTRFAFTRSRFLGDGSVKAGDTIRLPEQAAVLEVIAAAGRKGFYEGAIGAAIIDAVHGAGGVMTGADLAGYSPVEMHALRATFEGRTLLTMPPPSSGGLALAETFGILDRKEIAERAKERNWAAYAFLVVESFKHAFADRAKFLGDPAFVDVPVARLLSGAYLDQLARRVRIGKVGGSEMYGTIEPPPEDGGTSHLCVIDPSGMAVSCTETINLEFGSLVSSDRLGFCLNNQMDDFTTRRGEPNAFGLVQSDLNLPAPGKRPLSSMSPTIVLDKDGKVEMIAGASGGPRIITATAQVLLNVMVRGDDAAAAVKRARLHHQWKPYVVEIEDGFDDRHEGLGVDVWLMKVGNRVGPAKSGAAVQLIVRRGDAWQAACDPRKGGRPAGE